MEFSQGCYCKMDDKALLLVDLIWACFRQNCETDDVYLHVFGFSHFPLLVSFHALSRKGAAIIIYCLRLSHFKSFFRCAKQFFLALGYFQAP